MSIRVLLNGILCAMAFINFLLALWDHDLARAAGWSSATLGWGCAWMHVMGDES